MSLIAPDGVNVENGVINLVCVKEMNELRNEN